MDKPIYLSFNHKEFSAHNYRYVDNSSDDIYQAVVEFSGLVNERILDEELTELQQSYYDALPDDFCHKNKCVISNSFLKQYPELFTKGEINAPKPRTSSEIDERTDENQNVTNNLQQQG